MGVGRRTDSPFWWIALERPGQRPIRESTKIPVAGATPEQTKENRQLAQAVYAAKMGDLARARHQLPGAQTSARTFATFATWYTAQFLVRHGGAAREREMLAVLIAGFGTWRLPEITRPLVREWMTRRAAKVAASTVNREVDLLKSMLREAAAAGEFDVSPIVGLPRLRTVPPKRGLLSQPDERRLLAALQPEDRALLILGQDALVRYGDLLELRWIDVDRDRAWIGDPKDPVQGAGYWVPLSARAQRAVARLPKTDAYLFPIRRRPKDRNKAISQVLSRTCARLGIRYGRKVGGITFHWATRRTGASRMLAHGASLTAVQKVGHWKSPETLLRIYSDIISDEDRAAVELPAKRVVRFTSGGKRKKRRKRAKKKAA